MSDPIAVYVHIPFCPSKCGYCDFNSYAMEGEIIGRTVEAIISEIRNSNLRGRPAKTIFFGGGTPTYIPVEGLMRILDAVAATHPPVGLAEITSEANPGTVDAEKFAHMRRGGFNRISLGAQSFLDEDLIRLGRVHKSSEIERAVESARCAGFDNINLDLMFGLSQQSARGWSQNVERALACDVEHLSMYCLTIEPNTAYFRLQAKKELILPDDEAQVAMYEACCERVRDAGFHQYEISNFARRGLECQHNLEYWNGQEYAGYGPGAVASYQKDGLRIRTTNLKHPARYCEAIDASLPTEFETETLNLATLRTERIMLGVRLNEGLKLDELKVPVTSLRKLVDRGWIEEDSEKLRLTGLGRHFCSEVALELI